MVPSCMHKG